MGLGAGPTGAPRPWSPGIRGPRLPGPERLSRPHTQCRPSAAASSWAWDPVASSLCAPTWLPVSLVVMHPRPSFLPGPLPRSPGVPGLPPWLCPTSSSLPPRPPLGMCRLCSTASCGLPALWVQRSLSVALPCPPLQRHIPQGLQPGPWLPAVPAGAVRPQPRGPQSHPARALSSSSLPPSCRSVLCPGDPASVPQGLSSEVPAWQCRRRRCDPWSGRSPGEGNGNPLQYSCLGSSTDRGAWRAAVHGVARVGQDRATEHARARALPLQRRPASLLGVGVESQPLFSLLAGGGLAGTWCAFRVPMGSEPGPSDERRLPPCSSCLPPPPPRMKSLLAGRGAAVPEPGGEHGDRRCCLLGPGCGPCLCTDRWSLAAPGTCSSVCDRLGTSAGRRGVVSAHAEN